MTIEKKIARDIVELKEVEFYKSLWGYNDLRHILTCKSCFDCLVDNYKLLDVELNRQQDLLTDEKIQSLRLMLRSDSESDVNLAKELIDQFRTKRLKHERINRKRTDKFSKNL